MMATDTMVGLESRNWIGLHLSGDTDVMVVDLVGSKGGMTLYIANH